MRTCGGDLIAWRFFLNTAKNTMKWFLSLLPLGWDVEPILTPTTFWAAAPSWTFWVQTLLCTQKGVLANHKPLLEDRRIYGSRHTRILENNVYFWSGLLRRLQSQRKVYPFQMPTACDYAVSLSMSKSWMLMTECINSFKCFPQLGINLYLIPWVNIMCRPAPSARP